MDIIVLAFIYKYLNDPFALLVAGIGIILIFLFNIFSWNHIQIKTEKCIWKWMKMKWWKCKTAHKMYKKNRQNSPNFNVTVPPQLSCYLPGKHSEARNDSYTKCCMQTKKNTENRCRYLPTTFTLWFPFFIVYSLERLEKVYLILIAMLSWFRSFISILQFSKQIDVALISTFYIRTMLCWFMLFYFFSKPFRIIDWLLFHMLILLIAYLCILVAEECFAGSHQPSNS
jgi:hypothetical protein